MRVRENLTHSTGKRRGNRTGIPTIIIIATPPSDNRTITLEGGKGITRVRENLTHSTGKRRGNRTGISTIRATPPSDDGAIIFEGGKGTTG